MLRVFGYLVTLAVGLGGFLLIDFNMSRQWASAEDEQGLTFQEYLGGLSERLAVATRPDAAAGLPTALADMMPLPPEGWTMRPTTPEDAAVFLPRRADTAPPEGRQLIDELVAPVGENSPETVVVTYERGERRVVIRAVRYPDVIFTSFMAMQQRFELQMLASTLQTRPFMTVRGLDVAEQVIPAELRARLFVADVGAQIHLRVMVQDRMEDADLVPFLQTLHVKAMNASVVDKQEGLGDVPVIVLASAMEDIAREAYQADLDAREAEAARQAEEDRKAAEAEAAAAGPAEPAKPAPGLKSDCTTSATGIKSCTVGN